MKEKLTTYLKEMHLPTVRKAYEETARRAEKENFSYEMYLFELIQMEHTDRFNNRVNRFMRESKLPEDKNFDTYQMKRLPKKVAMKVNALRDGSFLKRKENVLAFGKPGTGKTHLCCAIGQELIRKGFRVYFADCSLFVQELLNAKNDLKLARIFKRLSKYDALIIDEIGYVQQSRDEMEVLFTLLAERYEKGSVMITSNLNFSKWERIFKDPMITAAAIDRLVHHSIILEMNLDSIRMEEALEKNRLIEAKEKRTD